FMPLVYWSLFDGRDFEGEGEIVGLLRGEIDGQAFGGPGPFEFRGRAEEVDIFDRLFCEGFDDNFAVRRPGESDCVEGGAFAGEADVFGGERATGGVLEGAGGDPGRTFAIDFPRARAVDGFSVRGEPAADFREDFARFVGNGAVG